MNVDARAEDIEACVDVLSDEALRARFSVMLKQFLTTLDTVLPRPEALPFVGDAKRLGINLREAAQVRSCVLKRNAAQLRALQTTRQEVARDTKIVDGKSWEQSVPDVETLRCPVEANGDEGFGGRSGFPCMLECAFQELIADTASLMTRADEQLRQKPQLAADPAECEAKHFTLILSHPQPIRVIPQGEQLELSGTKGRH